MMNAIVISIRFLLKNIRKILLIISFSVVFLFILFPMNDVSDWVSSQVSQLTQNRVYVQFDSMSINPITSTLGLENVLVETPQVSGLTSDRIRISPSWLAAIQKKPGGTLSAEGLFGGQVEVSVTPLESGENTNKSKIELTAEALNLKDVQKTLNLNLPISGKLSANSVASADLMMTEQPDVDLNLVIQKFELSSTTVATPMMGSVNVPQIKFEKVELKGKLANGKFTIETGRLGTAKDDLYGEIKGELGLTLMNMQGQIVPQLGAYNVTVDLKANTSFQQRAGLFLSFLDSSKTMAGSTAQYRFRVQGDPMGMFNLTPIR